MIPFLKLIRWPNLLIVASSMVLILFCVIKPLLQVSGFATGMSAWQFLMLVGSTLLITAGGYLINDFFDMEPDGINKPGRNMVGKRFAVARVQLLYWLFTVSGVLLGTLLSWKLGHLNYALIFVFAAGLLWFYSERYKCIPVVGNVVIAFLSALSFGLVWVYEFFALSLNAQAFSMVQANFALVNRFVLIYMGFAFLTGFLREVVKDVEDLDGDKRYGCNTFAVAYGPKKSKILGFTIVFAGLLLSVWLQSFFYRAGFMMLLGYFIVIDALFIAVMVWLPQAKGKTDFKKLSAFIKVLMVIGIASMALVYFEM